MRVLLADDNRSLADSIGTLLRARGADVRIVYDGAEAVRALVGERFDAVLVDLRLPGVPGPDVLAAIDDDSVLRFAMTGYDTDANIARARDAGAQRVFRKPFALPELFEALGREQATPGDIGGARVAVLGVADESLRPLGTVCRARRFEDAAALRRSVAEEAWDAAVVCETPGADELIDDLGFLDEDLVVVRSAAPTRVAEAVQRTEDRRARTDRRTELEQLYLDGPEACLLVAGSPPRVKSFSRAAGRLLGFRPGDLDDGDLGDLEGDHAGGGLTTLVAAALDGSAGAAGEVEVRTLAEGERLLRVSARPLGERGTVALSFDEPDARDGHAEALRRLGATAAAVAHEMRNTLGGVSGSLRVLAGRIEDGSPAAELLARTQERVHRATTAMNDLLAFARPANLRLRVVPAEMVLEAAAGPLREAGTDVEIAVEVADPGMRLMVDPARVQMALLDLGRNALKALDGRGRVVLGCRRRGRWVELFVQDDGPGVDVDIADRVFEPFFTTHADGSGLGLANVRKLAEAHGGSAVLEPSERGARFVLRLPTRPKEGRRE